MRVVITGAAGFLGSHLVERFMSDGHEVVGLDNFLTGSEKNIAHLFGRDGFRFIKQDVTEYLVVDGAVDGVLHLASPASPIDYLKLPIQTLKVGSLGTHKTLGLARAKGARYLIASTSEVYGDPLVHPQTEDYWGNVNPIGPRGVYDEAKRFAESITMAYHNHHQLEVRIARIFKTYGPRMRLSDGRVVPNLVAQALKGEPMTVYGDGSQTRSFCYVSDLVEGLYKLFMGEHTGPINLGNPGEYSILDFAKIIQEEIQTKSRIVFEPLPVDDPKVRRPDITRAKTLLGWEPKVALRDGLRETVQHFRKELGLG